MGSRVEATAMQGAVTSQASQKVLRGRCLSEASRSQAGSSLVCWMFLVSGPLSQENSLVTSVIVTSDWLLLLPCPVLVMPQVRDPRGVPSPKQRVWTLGS